MFTWANNLFYLIFLGQIFLISYYFPQKVLNRMKYVLETYPPSQYPKLYPKSIEYYKMGQWAYKMINRGILMLGLVILLAIVFWVDHSTFADDGFISEAWPAAYGMIQCLPILALEFSEFSQFKLMRNANSATTRKAELRRRGLLDFVSPMILSWALVLYFGAIFFDLYTHDFVFQWGHDTFQRALVLTATNLLFALVGAWNLYGQKLNPHQAIDDRTRQIGAALKSMLYVSMAMSVFFMTQAADDVFEMDFLDASLMSLYFQLIVFLSIGHVLRSLNLEDIDFDVYKNDAAVS